MHKEQPYMQQQHLQAEGEQKKGNVGGWANCGGGGGNLEAAFRWRMERYKSLSTMVVCMRWKRVMLMSSPSSLKEKRSTAMAMRREIGSGWTRLILSSWPTSRTSRSCWICVGRLKGWSAVELAQLFDEDLEEPIVWIEGPSDIARICIIPQLI